MLPRKVCYFLTKHDSVSTGDKEIRFTCFVITSPKIEIAFLQMDKVLGKIVKRKLLVGPSVADVCPLAFHLRAVALMMIALLILCRIAA
jgi:hypothetical protein